MKRKHCRTPSSKPSVRLKIGQALVFSTISFISDLCLLLRLFCQYTSCLPEVRGHAVHHGQDPCSWNLPRPRLAQFRVRLTVKFLLLKWNIGFCVLCFWLPSSVCVLCQIWREPNDPGDVAEVPPSGEFSHILFVGPHLSDANLIMLCSSRLSSSKQLNSAEILAKELLGGISSCLA